ncbi:MAG: tetratricopeptide repeat protein [Anaerolineae bacterium]|nr:tetratricopeptide repeat protein [Anaerolineae bacterium]
MNDDTNKTVFISYRRSVAAYVARAVFQDLHAHGWDAFMDVESIDSGEFDRIILNQIAARAHFIVILTPGTLDRCDEPNDWLRREIEYAFEKDRNIVPLMTNGFDFGTNESHLTGQLAELKRRNALNVPYDYFDEAMERLRSRYLKQPVYGAVVPTPVDDRAEVARRVNHAAAQPQVTTEQLSAEEYFRRAYKKHQEDHDLPGAIEDYSQAIRLNPSFAMAYNNRAWVRLDMDDVDGALVDVDAAAGLDPKLVYAYYNRGIALDRKGDYDDAITAYNNALAIDTTYLSAYYNRALTRYRTGDYSGSMVDYETAIKLDPSFANAYWGLGNCHYNLKDWARALDAYEKYVQTVKGAPTESVVKAIKELKQKLGRS